MIMKATEVAPMIYQMLVDAVAKEYAGESEQVKQEAIARILGSIVIL